MATMLVELKGMARTLRRLDEVVGRKARDKHVLIALSAGGGVYKLVAVAKAPRDTKTLAKNLIVKVKIRKSGDGGYAMLGAKRRVKFAVATIKNKTKVLATFRTKKDKTVTVTGMKRLDKAKAAGRATRFMRPSRYLHLAEKKHGFLKETQNAKKNEATRRTRDKLYQSLSEALKNR